MLSHGLRQVLDGVPDRLPIRLEVRDRSLSVIVPDASARPASIIDLSGELREQLLAAPATRPRTVVHGGERIDLLPLAAPGQHQWSLLLVLSVSEEDAPLLTTWSPLLRAAVEADLGATADISRQTNRARHLAAVLRFITYLAGMQSQPDVLRAMLQAAAVWFDLDARIYRRIGPGGDFVSYVALPGAPPASQPIPAAMVEGIADVVCFSSVADLETLGVPAEAAALIPIGAPPAELLLLLAGTLPADVALTFGAVARVAASVLDRSPKTDRIVSRKPLASAFATPSGSVTETLTRAVRALVDLTNAAGARIVARLGDDARLLAAFGDLSGPGGLARGDRPPSTGESRLSVTVAAGAGAALDLELFAAEGARFDAVAKGTFEYASDLLSAWASGPGTQDAVRRAVWGARSDRATAFMTRLDEEIARAKRFRLEFAVVVVRSESADDAAKLEELQRVVRGELRTSDVLAPLGPAEVAALLIHTERAGGEAVVRRIQTRLAENSAWEGPLAVGYGVFSPDLATPAALLAAARVPAAEVSPALSVGRR